MIGPTSGPWRWNPWKQNVRCHNVLGTDNHPVLRVTEKGEVYIPNKYDALLIAAAPNLLEALKLLLSQTDTGDPCEHVTVGKHIIKAERAIAKAEGKL